MKLFGNKKLVQLVETDKCLGDAINKYHSDLLLVDQYAGRKREIDIELARTFKYICCGEREIQLNAYEVRNTMKGIKKRIDLLEPVFYCLKCGDYFKQMPPLIRTIFNPQNQIV